MLSVVSYVYLAAASSTTGWFTKILLSLAATAGTGGWNLAWRSSVCVWRCVFVFVPNKRAWQSERPIAKRHITSKWIYTLVQDLVQRLVSQRTADQLFGPTGKMVAWQWEGLVTNRPITSKWIHVKWPNIAETYICIGHGLPRLFTSAPPPSITHQPFVINSCVWHHCRQEVYFFSFFSNTQ